MSMDFGVVSVIWWYAHREAGQNPGSAFAPNHREPQFLSSSIASLLLLICWTWGPPGLCSSWLKVSSNSISALSRRDRERRWVSKACLSSSKARLSCCRLLKSIGILLSARPIVWCRIMSRLCKERTATLLRSGNKELIAEHCAIPQASVSTFG